MLIRLIGVKLSGLVCGTHQINLFEDTPEMLNLYSAIDKMKKKYGNYAVRRAVSNRHWQEEHDKTHKEKMIFNAHPIDSDI